MPETGKSYKLANTIIEVLKRWETQYTTYGGQILDDSFHFMLSDGKLHQVDAGWVNAKDWQAARNKASTGTPYLCPDFVVKLAESSTANLTFLKTEMETFQQAGCPLGWLIEPEQEQVFIYKPREPVHQIPTFDYYLDGRDILKGFEFPLKRLRF